MGFRHRKKRLELLFEISVLFNMLFIRKKNERHFKIQGNSNVGSAGYGNRARTWAYGCSNRFGSYHSVCCRRSSADCRTYDIFSRR